MPYSSISFFGACRGVSTPLSIRVACREQGEGRAAARRGYFRPRSVRRLQRQHLQARPERGSANRSRPRAVGDHRPQGARLFQEPRDRSNPRLPRPVPRPRLRAGSRDRTGSDAVGFSMARSIACPWYSASFARYLSRCRSSPSCCPSFPQEDRAGRRGVATTIRAPNCLFEPEPDILLEQLVPRQVNVQIWRALLESNAGFFAAQMTAMDNATKNAGEIIEELTREMNKERQASIYARVDGYRRRRRGRSAVAGWRTAGQTRA